MGILVSEIQVDVLTSDVMAGAGDSREPAPGAVRRAAGAARRAQGGGS